MAVAPVGQLEYHTHRVVGERRVLDVHDVEVYGRIGSDVLGDRDGNGRGDRRTRSAVSSVDAALNDILRDHVRVVKLRAVEEP